LWRMAAVQSEGVGISLLIEELEALAWSVSDILDSQQTLDVEACALLAPDH